MFSAAVSAEAFSPILPGDYRRTSYPVAVFRWTLRNPTGAPLDLSLLLSWRNTVGWFTNTDPSAAVHFRDDGSPEHNYVPAIGATEGQRNRCVDAPGLRGILLEGLSSGPIAEGEGQWCLAVPDAAAPGMEAVEVFRCSRWDPSGDGAELWEPFSRNGSIPESDNDRRSRRGDPASAALAVRCRLQPGESIEIPFVISWDLPVTAFASGCRALRRYTDFFGASGDNAVAIATEALRDWRQWREAIEAWQAPVAGRDDLPEPLRMALLNELYDLASGGSLWTTANPEDPVGRFGVLECLDYAWYESLDVRLYGSFALLQLWPELDKAVLRCFARAIPAADPTPRPIGWYFTQGRGRVEAPRKLAGATPHDLGAPNERPFDATNYTAYQDCNLWKDLASDFVLQVWRTYRLAPTGRDIRFLADCWPAAVTALEYLKRFDVNDDGLPDNGGAPDQTFDDWPLQGVSAYCGALWIAALEAALAIGQQLQLELGLDTAEEQRRFGGLAGAVAPPFRCPALERRVLRHRCRQRHPCGDGRPALRRLLRQASGPAGGGGRRAGPLGPGGDPPGLLRVLRGRPAGGGQRPAPRRHPPRSEGHPSPGGVDRHQLRPGRLLPADGTERHGLRHQRSGGASGV